MAVIFEVDPTSAEVKTRVDSVDLANGDSIVEQQQSEPAELQESTPAEESSVPQVDPELLRKWEQDCNEATKQHAISIEQTKALMVELDKQISYKTDELKSIKDEKKGAVERLIRLETRGPELPPKPQAKKVSGNGATTESDSTAAGEGSSAACDANQDTSWRLIRTSKILEGIERLGQKKHDSITECFPTLGDLEDIRGEASKEFVHFADKLPDGIGKTIADKIEERMMDEIAKYSVGIKPAETTEQNELITSPADEGVEYEDTEDTDDSNDVADTLADV